MSVTIEEVVRELQTLPAERISEVYDFVLFLRTRGTRPVDQSDEWTDEDLVDAANSSRSYAEHSMNKQANASG